MSSVIRYGLVTMPVEIRGLPYDDATKRGIFNTLIHSIMNAIIDEKAKNPHELLGARRFSPDGMSCIVNGLFDVTAYNRSTFDVTVAASLQAAGLGGLVDALEVNEILINQQHLTVDDTALKINPTTGAPYVLHWFVGKDSAGNAVLWTRKTQSAEDSRAACKAYINEHW